MIVLHGKCNMCGRSVEAVEVEVPHATGEHRKALGVSWHQILCTAVCKGCAEAITRAWARNGAADWARIRAEREAAKRAADTGTPEDAS